MDMNTGKIPRKKSDTLNQTTVLLAGDSSPGESQAHVTSLLGVVVKVENLTVARAFYRDVLELGPPVMDSTFWVEFKIGESASLFLEQAQPGEKLVPTKGRIAWICETKNIDTVIKNLEEVGHDPIEGDKSEKVGFNVLKYRDPEGNPFYIKPEKC